MWAIIGGIILIVAAVLNSWYAGNAKAAPGNASALFYIHGSAILILTIMLLIIGLIIFWIKSGFLIAIAAAAVYFFILPLIFVPLLEILHIIPGENYRFTPMENRPVLIPKAYQSSWSSFDDYPLLKLCFDEFFEFQTAARNGLVEIGMQRSYAEQGDYKLDLVLADENLFLHFYRNYMLRIKLSDGTIISREKEERLWNKLLHPERNPLVSETTDNKLHPKAREEIEALIKEIESEEEAIIKALKIRYGIN